MKVYPEKKPLKQQYTEEEHKQLLTKKAALVFAFISVFYFFIKLVFL